MIRFLQWIFEKDGRIVAALITIVLLILLGIIVLLHNITIVLLILLGIIVVLYNIL